MSLTEAQREARTKGIGGSDVPSILGLKPSALETWESKVYPLPPDEESAEAEVGSALEEGVAKVAARRLGLALRRDLPMSQHPRHPWMLANVDGLLGEGKDRSVLEVKCVRWERARNLGDEGTDEILPEHLVQVEHYLEVLGLDTAHVAYLCDATTVRLFRVERSDRWGTELRRREWAFWRRVLEREPPQEPDPAIFEAFLKRRFPRNETPKLIESSDPGLIETARRVRLARTATKAAESERSAAENLLRARIGADAGFETPAGRITWLADKNGKRTLRVPSFEGEEQ